MPILNKEVNLYPSDLLDRFAIDDGASAIEDESGRQWWALYTMSRHEKQLMRKLVTLDVSFYGPQIEKRYRSPAGRLRTSYGPLFSGYVFIHGDESQRYASLTTNCVSKWFPIPNQLELVVDLRRVKRLIETGQPLTPEAQLEKGDRVRVKTGPFTGIDGVVIRRQNQVRLLVGVNYMQQGVSVVLEECEVEALR